MRRTAEIFLLDADDYESLFAKFGLNGYWNDEHFEKLQGIIDYLDKHNIPYPARIRSYAERNAQGVNFGSGLHHRRMSNNSVAFTSKPSKIYLDMIFKMMQLEGEPGFVQLEEMARRIAKQLGIVGREATQKFVAWAVKKLGINPLNA